MLQCGGLLLKYVMIFWEPQVEAPATDELGVMEPQVEAPATDELGVMPLTRPFKK